MAPISSPTDLPTVRVTSLFPFPVEGRVVKDDEVYLRLNLGHGSLPWEDPDVRADLWHEPFDPFLGVHTTADAKWLRANVDDVVVLFKMPFERLPFQVEDKVRLRSKLEVSGEVIEVCGSAMVKVTRKSAPSASPQKYRPEDLVLDNWSTTPPMKVPTD